MSTPRDQQEGRRIFIAFFLCLFLLITNNILDFDNRITSIAASDTYDYVKIAESFPHLPSGKIVYHRAQRFVFPFLMGMVAYITGTSCEIIFRVATISLFFLIVFLFHKITKTLNLSFSTYLISISLFVFSPYTFRNHISYPGLVIDLAFVLGLTILFLGLQKCKFSTVIVGVVIMTLGRQTAFLCIPGIIFYFFSCEKWSNYSNKTKIIQSLIITFCIVSLYEITGKIASSFALESWNFLHIFGIFYWFVADFNLIKLLQFIIRFIFTFILPASIVFGIISLKNFKIKQHLSYLLPYILFIVLICSQPLLGGPDITGANVQRLSALSYVPLIIAFALFLEKNRFFEIVPPFWLALLEVAIVISSFHHILTFLGTYAEKTVHFAVFSFAISFLVFITVLLLSKKKMSNSQSLP